MKYSLQLLVCAMLILYLGCTTQKNESQSKPNILFILMDDLGWSAISSYGNTHVQTTNIDRLAEEGMRFTDAYVTPQCTPTRAVIMTGQHTANNRMWHVTPRYYFPYQTLKEPEYLEDLPRETFTIGKALKQQGYKTAIFGKWHLNVYGEDGYYTRLFEKNAHHYGFDVVDPMTDPSEYHQISDKGVDFLTDQAISFMEENRDDPFFIYLSHHTIHGPILAPDSLVQKYLDLGYPETGINHAAYLASVEHFDLSIGRLMEKLDELGIADKTLVIFTSDNGGVDTYFDNAPLRYGKGSPYEGGIRVPFIVRWPGSIPHGKVEQTPIHAIDFYPTLLEIAGGKPAEYEHLDGISLLPTLKGEGEIVRESLKWYMPLYDPLTYSQWATTPAAVIRKGDYKLLKFFGDYTDISSGKKRQVQGKRLELYNLKEDIGESQNLVDLEPAMTSALEAELDAWIASTGAGLPTPNENYLADSVWIRRR